MARKRKNKEESGAFHKKIVDSSLYCVSPGYNLMLRFLTFLLFAGMAAAYIYALDKPGLAPGAPPLGKFFSPVTGFWQNSDPGDPSGDELAELEGLSEEVIVRYDDRMTPHIFAQNDRDLYFAQGYVTARMRLWQMDIQTRAAGGRLAEILGPSLLPTDRYHRRIGMRRGAEAARDSMLNDTLTAKVVQAYADGVNAYINSLSPEEYPLEFKLLNYAPEPWTPLKTALLLKYMAKDLTARERETQMTAALRKYGATVVHDLFPAATPFTKYIVPGGTKFDFKPEPRPKPQKLLVDDPGDYASRSALPGEDSYMKGSNNWAIAGERADLGYPMLANDPHLGLSLPSLWFEVQLHTPEHNAYGVSLPGAPCVIIGFNEHICWGVTNTGADVWDWYKEKLNPEFTQYYHDRKWKDLRVEIDTIRVLNESEAFLDTVYFTEHGPLVYPKGDTTLPGGNAPPMHALRWAAHDPSNELRAFVELNRAKNYRAFRRAARYLSCPAQNFAYADARNNIAFQTAGKIPVRWENQGRYILDGTDPDYDWHGFIPFEQLPHLRNPERGYVSTANQIPVDSLYPYYLGWHFETFERGRRINSVLDSMQKAGVDSMRALQNDVFNELARWALPRMLDQLPLAKLNDRQRRALDTLRAWDLQNTPGSVGATIFEQWWDMFSDAVWADDFPEPVFMAPSSGRTARLLLKDSTSKWYDDQNTPDVREMLPDVLFASFQQNCDSLYAWRSDLAEWRWADYKGTSVPHITREKLRSLGRWNLPVGGGKRMVNAAGSRHGPSWRMVVRHGPYLKGYGVYPGGQSGNPASKYYDNCIDDWVAGRLQELLFLRAPETSSSKIKKMLVCKLVMRKPE